MGFKAGAKGGTHAVSALVGANLSTCGTNDTEPKDNRLSGTRRSRRGQPAHNGGPRSRSEQDKPAPNNERIIARVRLPPPHSGFRIIKSGVVIVIGFSSGWEQPCTGSVSMTPGAQGRSFWEMLPAVTREDQSRDSGTSQI